MSIGGSFVKYFLFISNLLFAVAGIALIILGVVTKFQLVAIDDISDANFQVAAYILMAVGGIVFIIAFFGCCGAISENKCLLVTYSSIMLILMATQVTLAVLLLVKRDDITAELTKLITNAFNNNRSMFHEFEDKIHCCGAFGASSYGFTSFPNSCCANPPCLNISELYGGCTGVVNNFFTKYSVTVAVSTIIVAALELLAAIFGLCLSNHVREMKSY